MNKSYKNLRKFLVESKLEITIRSTHVFHQCLMLDPFFDNFDSSLVHLINQITQSTCINIDPLVFKTIRQI